MAFYLAHPKMILSDSMGPLIEFYQVLQNHPAELSYALAELRMYGIDKESYLKIRAVDADTPIMRAARFLYLNKVGFNGLHRENSKGKFNVPYGDGDPTFPSRDEIQEAAKALKYAYLGAGDFEKTLILACSNDIVVADPPYHTTFTNYNKGGFSEDDQERLATALYHASERGAAVIAHNHDTSLVRYLYGEWATITPVQEARRGNSDPTKRGERAQCVVITKGIDLGLPPPLDPGTKPVLPFNGPEEILRLPRV